MHSLFEALRSIDDPRREQGRRYPMACCLALVVCGVLAALLLARGKESTRVPRRRLSGKPHLLLSLLKSSGPLDLITSPFQEEAKGVLDGLLVVNDEDARHEIPRRLA